MTTRCPGSFPTFLGQVQGACGSAKDHEEHDFSDDDRVCPGGVSWAAADCGRAVDHDEHPLNQPQVEAP